MIAPKTRPRYQVVYSAFKCDEVALEQVNTKDILDTVVDEQFTQGSKLGINL